MQVSNKALSSDNDVSSDYLLALLREFLQNDSAMFKSEEQKEALKQILKKTSCLEFSRFRCFRHESVVVAFKTRVELDNLYAK